MWNRGKILRCWDVKPRENTVELRSETPGTYHGVGMWNRGKIPQSWDVKPRENTTELRSETPGKYCGIEKWNPGKILRNWEVKPRENTAESRSETPGKYCGIIDSPRKLTNNKGNSDTPKFVTVHTQDSIYRNSITILFQFPLVSEQASERVYSGRKW